MPKDKIKNDFTGQPKKPGTYDKDWVLYRDKKTGTAAWITKAQHKKIIQDQKEQKKYLANIRQIEQQRQQTTPAAGTTPELVHILPPPTGTPPKDVSMLPPGPQIPVPVPPAPVAGLDPSSTKGEAGLTQSPTSSKPLVPSWWINAAYANPQTEDQKFANIANALLPTLSPEDQRTLAMYLAQNHKDVFGDYANARFDEAPTRMTSQIRNQFLSPQRAQTALDLLDRMRRAAGVEDMGPGYDFLRNAINLLQQFSGGGPMTREKYAQFESAVAALNKNVPKDLSAYGNLAQMFNLPSFTAGPLVSNAPNPNFF